MLTPTEQRIFDKLKDGQFHSNKELVLELYTDGPRAFRTLYQHIYGLRQKLKESRPDLILVSDSPGGVLHYRLARLVPIID